MEVPSEPSPPPAAPQPAAPPPAATPATPAAPAAAEPVAAPSEPPKPPPKAEPLLIPKAAVKRIMKLDRDVNQVANDAVILVAKATELFLEKVSRDSHAHAVGHHRRSIKYEDVADAQLQDPSLEFLSGVVPQPKNRTEPPLAPQPPAVVPAPPPPAVAPQNALVNPVAAMPPPTPSQS